MRDGGPPWLSEPLGTEDLIRAQPRRSAVVLIESDRPSHDENERLLTTARRCSAVVAVVGRLDLVSDRVLEHLNLIEASPEGLLWRGMRLLRGGADGDAWTSRADGVAARLAAAGRVVEIAMRGSELLSEAELAKRIPGSVVLDHLGDPPWYSDAEEWSRWERGFVAIAGVEHVIAKLSALPHDAGEPATGRVRRAVDLALEHFGPDRLMFGSNWPWTMSHTGSAFELAKSLTAGLASEQVRAIFFTTAARVYGIDPRVRART